jgi:hypothetical protein
MTVICNVTFNAFHLNNDEAIDSVIYGSGIDGSMQQS